MLLGPDGPLLLRFYLIHGGKRIWLSSLLQVAGWPLALLPLFLSYLRPRRRCNSARVIVVSSVPAACWGSGSGWSWVMVKEGVTYALAMEMQLIIGFFATLFCLLGMLFNQDFRAMEREAKNFEFGEMKILRGVGIRCSILAGS
ncbi:putative purine permease, plant [Dioscorea sansibarensis]